MLITIAGLHGTGKTTIAQELARNLNIKHVSTGMVFRNMAKEHGMSLLDFSQYATNHPEIDQELDERMRSIGLKNDVVLDGQLCWFFLDKEANWKIMFTCQQEIRVERIRSRILEISGKKLEIEEIRRKTLERERIERKRYKKIYGIDLDDEEMVRGHHDLIIDTSDKPVSLIVKQLLPIIRGKS